MTSLTLLIAEIAGRLQADKEKCPSTAAWEEAMLEVSWVSAVDLYWYSSMINQFTINEEGL